MHFTNGAILNGRVVHTLLASILAVGLAVFGVGCGGAGSNGEGDGNGDGNGDGGDTVVPAAPTGLETVPTDGEVSLSWEASADAESYNVYRATESGVDATGPVVEGRTDTSYADTGLENGTTYFYVVTAVADEESDPSGEAKSTPFTTPSGLAGTSGDGQVDLEWASSAGADTYNVYRSTSSTDGATGDPITSGVSETAYTDSSDEVTNGTKYYYRVTAVNPEDEESDGSGEIAKTPFSSPPDRPEE